VRLRHRDTGVTWDVGDPAAGALLEQTDEHGQVWEQVDHPLWVGDEDLPPTGTSRSPRGWWLPKGGYMREHRHLGAV
jgi:hypothetical protein